MFGTNDAMNITPGFHSKIVPGMQENFSYERHDINQSNSVGLDLAYQLCYSKSYMSIIRVHTVLILHQTFWQVPWS